MIDERLLADPLHCPSCTEPLAPAGASCSQCGVSLLGPTAARLWQVSVQAAALLETRSGLIARLRTEVVPADGETPAAGPGRATRLPVPPPRATRPEWTPRRVQNLLLVLGVGLLGVAAVIFVAVSWGSLGVGGRAAVMTGVTALAAGSAVRAGRVGLTATAEALSALTVGLALVDLAGARASDLFGLGAVDGAVFAAASAGAVAVCSALGARVLPTRALRLSAAVLGQLAVPLLLAGTADDVAHPAALVGAGLTGQAVATSALLAWWPFGGRSRDARVTVGVGAAVAAVGAILAAGLAAYAEGGSYLTGAVLLLTLAATAGAAGERLAGRPHASAIGPGTALPGALRAVSAALVVGAAWSPVAEHVRAEWLALTLSVVALGLLAASALVPPDRRRVPAAVLLVAVAAPGADVVLHLATALAGRLQWLEQPWTSGTGSARELLAGTYLADPTYGGAGWWPAVLLLLTVAVALVLAPVLVPASRNLVAAVPPVLAGTTLLVAAAADLAYGVALGLDLVVALLTLAVGAHLHRARRPWPGTSALLSGAAVLALVVSWSLAVAEATLVVLPAAAAVLAVAVAAGHGLRAMRGARVWATAAAVLLLVAEGGAVARYDGAGRPAVLSLVLALLALAAAAAAAGLVARAPAADPFWVTVRRAVAVVTAAAAVADVGAVSRWQGAGVAGVGLAVAVAAAVLLAASTLPLHVALLRRADLRLVAGPAGMLGLLAAGTDPDRLWTALLAVGVGLAVLGLREDRRWGWAAGVMLTSSTWVRLAESDVSAPEAYTVAPALALLAVGLHRRRRDPACRSWPAYAPGLVLALLPSLLRAVTDAGDLRPLLLGLAALAVLGAGVQRRLQAPLVIGAAVLAVDALVQLAPYLAAAYGVVPRWVTIGIIGLLLLGSGVTYEQRVRDLRRVGREVARLG